MGNLNRLKVENFKMSRDADTETLTMDVSQRRKSTGVRIVESSQKPAYWGKRALILTRVSTAKQEEKYSHAAQERQVREKLIVPLGLRIVDEKKYIIHDTYSGLSTATAKPLTIFLRWQKDKNLTCSAWMY